jgi:two-component system nitrate/nitrite response regulator NarP
MTSKSKIIRVLIVSDCPIIQIGLKDLVNSKKSKMKVVKIFNNYQEMLSKLHDLSPDVILLDLDLDIDAGPSTITQIQEASTAKVLALTGLDDASLLEKIEHVATMAEIIDKRNPSWTIIEAIKNSYRNKSTLPYTAIAGSYRSHRIWQCPY